jgi:hypothetical protein
MESIMQPAHRKALIAAIPGGVSPLARALFYTFRGTEMKLRANIGPAPLSGGTAPVFIIGCGRSGTSILGDLFAMHPQVEYLYEPNARWAAVDPATDYLQQYSRYTPHCTLGAQFATSMAKYRFQRLMSPPRGRTLVEKTPINALRIGFLDAIAPGSRFVHIVRDGIHVSRSIEQIAAASRGVAFRPPLNNWWGVGNVKWTALAQEGAAAGYYASEVSRLTTDAERGAYEWLVSLREVDRWRARLGTRLIELRLDDLIDDPRETLASVITAAGLTLADEKWLDQAVRKVQPMKNNYDPGLILPGQMCADFNEWQEHYRFAGRASALEDSAVPGAGALLDGRGGV